MEVTAEDEDVSAMSPEERIAYHARKAASHLHALRTCIYDVDGHGGQKRRARNAGIDRSNFNKLLNARPELESIAEDAEL